MSRLGGAAAVAPLVADVSSEVKVVLLNNMLLLPILLDPSVLIILVCKSRVCVWCFCSLVLAVGHIVVAYRTSCRERRKLWVYKIDIEAVVVFKVGNFPSLSVYFIELGKK
ncbi:hypothetical protein PRUPE_6G160600 [Prunus persica]|uniref:Uncharacterized protein n=1 Tax=Prunus persica TaxID=3760 RepID=M5WJ26_PRUPE|nr:hypothetical protein PRUPE_6G160600 [Prunus persica]